jgi:hypothetical protein
MLRIRSGCLQPTFCRLKETVTLPQVTNLVKRASQLFQSRSQPDFLVPPQRFTQARFSKAKRLDASFKTQLPKLFTSEASGIVGLFRPMKQPLSPNIPEREAARQTRSL